MGHLWRDRPRKKKNRAAPTRSRLPAIRPKTYPHTRRAYLPLSRSSLSSRARSSASSLFTLFRALTAMRAQNTTGGTAAQAAPIKAAVLRRGSNVGSAASAATSARSEGGRRARCGGARGRRAVLRHTPRPARGRLACAGRMAECGDVGAAIGLTPRRNGGLRVGHGPPQALPARRRACPRSGDRCPRRHAPRRRLDRRRRRAPPLPRARRRHGADVGGGVVAGKEGGDRLAPAAHAAARTDHFLSP